VAVGAVSLTFLIERNPVPPAAKAPAAASAPPIRASAGSAADPKAKSRAALSAPAVMPEPVRPSFDVVRVNPLGDAVIAGRAAPGAKVTIREGKKDIGKVEADSRGEWVLVPDKPLPAGARELSVVATTPTGAEVQSAHKLVVVVPERGKDIAGRPSKRPAGALAILVPREGSGGTTVLQKPSGTPAMPAAASASAARILASKSAAPSRTATAGQAAAQKPAALTLDAVDYDDTGKLALSGSAPPKSRVQVYLGEKMIGSGTSADKGKWQVAPEKKVAIGIYNLRVDQVDDTGRVTARIMTKFQRAAPLTVLPGNLVVFVQPGNSLWRIARRNYGRGIQYTVIFEANRAQIGDPSLIYPGQVFVLPQVN
jgi:nucleoid-associated protein YgaU